MLRHFASLSALLLLAAITERQAEAQEFRVYTRVYDLSSKRSEPVARSLTLFHAGKVYDNLDALGEVIIFEPMQNRFTILNTRRALATTIHFDEIKRLMGSAEKVSRNRLQRLDRRSDRESTAAAEILRFQLDPRFDPEYEEKENRLTLSSRYLQYEVRLVKVQTKEVADVYRKYADAICRLNYVLHPRLLLPGPRMALNEHIHRKRAIPVDVVLQANLQSRVHLRANHQIRWSLDVKDRAWLNQWKSLLTDRNTRHVTFREYQRARGIKLSKRR